MRTFRPIFISMAAVLTASVGVMYLAGARAIELNKAVAQQLETMSALSDVLSTLKDAETGQRGYLLTSEEEYLQPYNSARASLAQTMTRIDAFAGDGFVQPEDVPTLKRLAGEKISELERTIEQRRRGGMESAAAIVRQGSGKRIMDEIRAVDARMMAATRASLRMYEEKARTANTLRSGIFVVAIITNVLFLAWSYQRLTREMAIRQRALVEVAEQKSLLSITLASIGDAVISTDAPTNPADARVTFMNPTAERITGWTSEKAQGRPLAEVFHIVNESTRERVESPVAKALRAGAIVGLANPTVLLSRDGTEWPIDDSAAPIRDERGKIIGVVMVFHEISERKRHEDTLETALNSLAERERRLRTMADAIPLLAWTAAPDGFINWYNRRWYDYTGTTPQGMEGWGWQSVHDQEMLPKVMERWKASIAGGEPFEMVFPLRGADGRFRSFLTRVIALKDVDGKVLQWFGTNTDIDEVKRAEDKLLESEERFRDVTDNMPHLAWIADPNTDGQIFWYNKAWLDYTGTTIQQMAGSGWKAVHHPDYVDRVAAKFEQHVKEGRDWEDIFPLRRHDGQFRWFLSRMRVIRDESGKITRLVGTNTDITEQREAAAAMQASQQREKAARAESDAANRSKDMFLATLSHEMRTPLNAIVGWMSILQRPGRTEEDLREGLDAIDRNTEAQVKLIEDVLDVSRIVSGKLRLEMRRCNLAEAVRAAVLVMRPAAEAKGIRIDEDIDASLDGLELDPARIQQVAWNLIANAVKFTPKGGNVRVALSRERSAAVLRVSDDGTGISPDFLPHVFDRFRQADGSSRRKYAGLGLGLSIVKQLVELHGGTVEAQSEGEGRGATFTVFLPVAAIASPHAAICGGGAPVSADDRTTQGDTFQPRNEQERSRPLEGVRIVVVDDEPDARRLLNKVLGSAGAEVVAVGTAVEAARAVRERTPHLLVSDVSMPETDGHDLIRQLRSLGIDASVLPAIALTAFAGATDADAATQAGFQVHIAKPVDPYTLLEVVKKIARPGTQVP